MRTAPFTFECELPDHGTILISAQVGVIDGEVTAEIVKLEILADGGWIDATKGMSEKERKWLLDLTVERYIAEKEFKDSGAW